VTYSIRQASVDDATAIALVHVQAWLEAHAHLFPPAFLAGLDVDARAERWAQILVDGRTRATVAEDADRVVIGWATARPGRDDDA